MYVKGSSFLSLGGWPCSKMQRLTHSDAMSARYSFHFWNLKNSSKEPLWVDLSKILGKHNLGEKNVENTDKCMGLSQVLGGRAPVLPPIPPKSTPRKSEQIIERKWRMMVSLKVVSVSHSEWTAKWINKRFHEFSNYLIVALPAPFYSCFIVYLLFPVNIVFVMY